jgi:hypothetical protein
MRRIVVTGMGAVSPLGCGVETNWSRLLAGRSGIRTLPEAITADLSAKVGGQVPDVAVDPEGGFDPDRVAPRKDQRKMDRFILFALLAADEAIAQADWKPEDARSRQRTATVIASGIGGFPAIADAVRTTDIKGIRRLSPNRREFPRATSSISTRTRLRPPSAITASWKRSRPSSAPMAASPSAQPSPPPAICSVPPVAWRRSSRSSRYAIRLRRKRSTSTIPIPPRRASI